jgi:hypothetical protein
MPWRFFKDFVSLDDDLKFLNNFSSIEVMHFYCGKWL